MNIKMFSPRVILSVISATFMCVCIAAGQSSSPALQQLKDANSKGTDSVMGKSNIGTKGGSAPAAAPVPASAPVKTSSGTYTVDKSSAPATAPAPKKEPKKETKKETKKEPEHTGSPH